MLALLLLFVFPVSAWAYEGYESDNLNINKYDYFTMVYYENGYSKKVVYKSDVQIYATPSSNDLTSALCFTVSRDKVELVSSNFVAYFGPTSGKLEYDKNGQGVSFLVEKKENYQTNVPIFRTYELAEEFARTGKCSADDFLYLPPGYFIDNGTIVNKPIGSHSKDIPVIEFSDIRYIRQDKEKDGFYQLHTKNVPKAPAGTTIWIEHEDKFEGMYLTNFTGSALVETKKSVVLEEFTNFVESENKLQGNLNELHIYQTPLRKYLESKDIKATWYEMLKSVGRFRYVYITSKEKKFGNWLYIDFDWKSETYRLIEKDGDGNTVDDSIYDPNKDHKVDLSKDQYGNNLNSLSDIFTASTTFIASVGSVPYMINSLLVFLPSEVMLYLSIGIGLLVTLRVLGR